MVSEKTKIDLLYDSASYIKLEYKIDLLCDAASYMKSEYKTDLLCDAASYIKSEYKDILAYPYLLWQYTQHLRCRIILGTTFILQEHWSINHKGK